MSIDFTSMSQQNHPHLPGHRPISPLQKAPRAPPPRDSGSATPPCHPQGSGFGPGIRGKNMGHHGVGLWDYGIKIMADFFGCLFLNIEIIPILGNILSITGLWQWKECFFVEY